MKRRGAQHQMDTLMALILFGVFAACVLAVLLTGARAYQRLTGRDQSAFDRRTAIQYIATRVRQSDTAGAITVEDFDGVTCLCISQDYDLNTYVTRVYCHDGYLRELFCSPEDELGLDAGEPVLEAQAVDFALKDGLLTVTATLADGTGDSLHISLRSGEGAAA